MVSSFRRPVLLITAAAGLLLPHTLVAAPQLPAATPWIVRPAPLVPADRPEHVLVISVDGLRPDAIRRFRARTMLRLMDQGSYSLAAQTINPSKTLPSHTSMLTGLGPEDHGVTWNSDRTDEHGHVDVPTIFARARTEGLSTAAFFSKTKFHHLETPGSLDHVESPQGSKAWNRWSADKTAGKVERYLENARPNLLFVHLGEPDFAGHLFGWMGRVYGRAVREADENVARVLRAADRAYGKGNYTVILTADHGGHGRGHGSDDARDTTIPWISWGKGVNAGTTLADGIRTMDTAATALWLLGVPPVQDGDGTPVTAAFATVPAVAIH